VQIYSKDQIYAGFTRSNLRIKRKKNKKEVADASNLRPRG